MLRDENGWQMLIGSYSGTSTHNVGKFCISGIFWLERKQMDIYVLKKKGEICKSYILMLRKGDKL